jgi:hypothetical protein
MLPHEEDQIDSETIKTIAQKVAEVEKLIETTEIAPALRSIIQHHIELIRTALRRYPMGKRSYGAG